MKFYQRKRRSPQVIIVSMIDIFAILLIFVIVTTTFKTQERKENGAEKKEPKVTIKLPESKSAVASAGPVVAPLVVSVTADEEILLDGDPIGLEQLAGEIRGRLEKSEGRSVALKADEKVSYGFLIRLLDAFKEGGLRGNLSAFTEAKK